MEIDPWEGWHSLAWAKVMCQDLGIDMVTELRRLDIIRAVGTERVREYYAPYRYDEQPTICHRCKDALDQLN